MKVFNSKRMNYNNKVLNMIIIKYLKNLNYKFKIQRRKFNNKNKNLIKKNNNFFKNQN